MFFCKHLHKIPAFANLNTLNDNPYNANIDLSSNKMQIADRETDSSTWTRDSTE